MGNLIRRLAVPVLAIGLVLAPQVATAQEDQAGAQVGIVEPAFRPVQEWNYDPGDLTVAVGTTVTWTNAGAVAHTVTADDGVSFDSGDLGPENTFSFTPDTPGAFGYHCTYHPWMTGTLTATP
jgi:plastocyanin